MFQSSDVDVVWINESLVFAKLDKLHKVFDSIDKA
jgi:hypothetical protein